MSIKRQATTQLTHENWDQDDPLEHEEMGAFKTASKDVLDKRVIRTAKRRSQVSDEETKKTVFSGFSGFNKTQPPSFDFLANLTNGNKNSTPYKNDTSVTSTLFSAKHPTSSSSGGLFGIPTTSASDKSSFGITTQASPICSKNTTTSIFSTLKPDSTVSDSPFKIQPVSSSGDTNTDSTRTVTSSTVVTSISKPIFGVATTASKSLFSSSNNTTPFKIQPVSSTTTVPTTNETMSKATPNTISDPKIDTNNEKKLKYYAKLKGLNESVSDWIKTHVEKTPLCILSPIFKDYEQYLKEIEEEYEGPDKDEESKDKENKMTENSAAKIPSTTTGASSFFSSPPPTSSSFFSRQTNPAIEGNNSKYLDNTYQYNPTPVKSTSVGYSNITPTSSATQNSTSSDNKPKGLLFGINSAATTSSTGFSFGINTTAIQTISSSSSGFSFATNTNTTTTNSTTPFSFGTGKPFSFNSNIKTSPTTSEAKNEENEEEEVPKVEFTPVVEENSLYDKRCKIFVKRDGSFVDRGVGTLYIKKVNETGKHQLLVRANTTLGNILLNLILSSVPIERIGKNNVMLVCIPTPDEKPPPTPVLIRVKTSEEADELLETLKKYKA